jgi:hypothetical protein
VATVVELFIPETVTAPLVLQIQVQVVVVVLEVLYIVQAATVVLAAPV